MVGLKSLEHGDGPRTHLPIGCADFVTGFLQGFLRAFNRGRARLLGRRLAGSRRGRSGTTNDVIGLSGYVTAENGEILAFAFIYNGRDRWTAKGAIDTMGATMAGFRPVTGAQDAPRSGER